MTPLASLHRGETAACPASGVEVGKGPRGGVERVLAVMGEPSETSKYCSSHSAPPLEGVFLSLFYCFTIVNMLLFFVLLVFIGDRLLPIPVATQGLEPMDARVGEREHV